MLTSPVLRVLVAIWALVLVVLGVAFLAVGLVVGTDEEGFVAAAAATLAPGLALALVTWVLHSRARAERRRRLEGRRATAEVIDARLHTMTRIGVMLTYTVTVRFTPVGGATGEFTRQVLVPPTHPLEAGRRIEVCYDPRDPRNFEPVSGAAPD